MHAIESLTWLTTVDLVPPVAAMTGGKTVRIDDLACEAITTGAGEALGVWRINGEATVDDVWEPFTLVLKGWPASDGSDDPTAWNWPDRERAAYSSGMLDSLPGGIHAPRCFGEMRQDGGSTWAWLSPMSTGSLERWDLEHFALVARRLGRFNGAYLTGEPVPDAPWLSRGWTRRWTESASEALGALPVAQSHQLIAGVYRGKLWPGSGASGSTEQIGSQPSTHYPRPSVIWMPSSGTSFSARARTATRTPG